MYSPPVREQHRFTQQLQELREKHQQFLAIAEEKMREEVQQLKDNLSKEKKEVMLKGQDAFYRILRLNPTITDEGEAYILSLKVPKHEVDQVSISAHDRKIKLTTSRRFEGKITPNYGEAHHTRRREIHTREFLTKDIVIDDPIFKHYKDGVLSFKIFKA